MRRTCEGSGQGHEEARPHNREEVATFVLRPRPPFRLDLTVWALRRLPLNEMDRWDGVTYRRVLPLNDGAVELAVRQRGSGERPSLQVDLACGGSGPGRSSGGASGAGGIVAEGRAELTRLLGLNVDLASFYQLASTDERLDRLAGRFMGLKPPRFPSVFEAVVNGIACQQLSLNVGLTLLNRLCGAFGRSFGEGHAFPTPHDLASADPDFVRSLGYSTQKARNIIHIAQAVDSGQLDLESLDGLDDQDAEKTLDGLQGVGRWTAQYVALRGLGRLDVFPADDVGSQNKMKQWQSLDHRPNYEEILRLLARFRPYRGLIYFHLLLNRLADQGLV